MTKETTPPPRLPSGQHYSDVFRALSATMQDATGMDRLVARARWREFVRLHLSSDARSLTDAERVVLEQLDRHVTDQGYAEISIRDFAREIGIDAKSVRLAIRRLCQRRIAYAISVSPSPNFMWVAIAPCPSSGQKGHGDWIECLQRNLVRQILD